jgi:hypothetical protein
MIVKEDFSHMPLEEGLFLLGSMWLKIVPLNWDLHNALIAILKEAYAIGFLRSLGETWVN